MCEKYPRQTAMARFVNSVRFYEIHLIQLDVLSWLYYVECTNFGGILNIIRKINEYVENFPTFSYDASQ